MTLIPASASLLGRFPTSLLAIVAFAANVILVQLSAFWLWRHAERRSMINPQLDPRVISMVGRRLALSAIVFVSSVPIAWINPTIAYVVWIGWFVLMFTTDWLSWEDATKTTREAFRLEDATRARIRLAHAGGPCVSQQVGRMMSSPEACLEAASTLQSSETKIAWICACARAAGPGS